ncbi:FtsX-like permease family protein [Streptomyces niveus]|uniref:FtsX-like permease family protein n=1 Tax=Streptomyces niveus TaxID=193462 RepID=UPI00342337DE
MFSLAIRSVAHRPGRLIATLLSAFLGSVIIMSFNSMHDTAAGKNIDGRSGDTLTIAASVVGGYGTLLVFFAIASTLTVNVRQRSEEISLLRRTGATPAQIKLMIVVESGVVAVVGMLLAIVPARIGGEQLLDIFKETDQVAEGVGFVFGPIALAAGVSVGLIASIGASFLAVRRATKAAAGGPQARGRGRNIGGLIAFVVGLGGIGATFSFKKTDAALMAAPAYGAILISVGFAVFSPVLLRFLLGKLARPITAVTGASGYLTVHNMRQRANQLSSVLMPLILFVGMASVTLYMQSIQNDALDASGVVRSVDDKSIETLNFVVVGIIVVFSCIMLINTLYAATTYRTREFGQQRLAGATPGQVLGMVAVESLVLTVTGVFFGTVAALAGAVPFSLVRVDAVLPDQGPGIWLAIVGIGAAATIVTSVATAHRALRTPAVEAVSLAA